MKSAEMDGRELSEGWRKDGEEVGEEKKAGAEERGDRARGLIPAIVTGSCIIDATRFPHCHRESRPARPPRWPVVAEHVPIAKPPVNTFISRGDQSVKLL